MIEPLLLRNLVNNDILLIQLFKNNESIKYIKVYDSDVSHGKVVD